MAGGGEIYELADAPRDGITAVRFSADAQSLLVSSWDSTIRLYNVSPGAGLRTKLVQPTPLLDCDFISRDEHVLSGGLDNAVRLHVLGEESARVLGHHTSSVRCVRNCASIGAAVSGSWDRSLKLWDVRSAQPCVGTFSQPDKVFSLCAGLAGNNEPPLLVVATAGALPGIGSQSVSQCYTTLLHRVQRSLGRTTATY